MTKIRRSTTKKNKINVTNTFEQHAVIEFLKILNMIKLYHWKTTSYATHKATDELYSKLSDNVDHFIEVLLGKDSGSRIQMNQSSSISLLDLTSEV
jgi:DNA-binding ferritin-like protein